VTIRDDITGRGLRFPLVPDARGRLGYAAGADNIEQSLKLVLLTALRERIMRNAFGSRVRELLFSPASQQNLRLLEDTIAEAIRDWEPRVEVEIVEAAAQPEDPAHVVVDLKYRIRATYVRGNLVFPFYLEGAGEVVG
jgi:uncharacterized protein